MINFIKTLLGIRVQAPEPLSRRRYLEAIILNKNDRDEMREWVGPK